MKRLALIFLPVLAACVTTTPPTAVHQPMTARPQVVASSYSNGSIFSAAQSRPLFEDRHARMVGDTITINIVENTAASKKSGTTAERTQTVSAGVPVIENLPFKGVGNLSLSANDSNKFGGKGENTSTNVFTSTITVTVIEALPNGNLLVSGEKQIGLKEGEEFIRFSGIVNPTTITTANTVQSSQVADARIEYKANGFLDDAQVMGWLARFFLTVMPF
jgi:flagellar L-ring protein precursor FlgH